MSSFCQNFKNEWRRDNFGFRCLLPDADGHCGWIPAYKDAVFSWIPGPAYVVLRVVLTLVLWGGFIWSIAGDIINGFSDWYYYLTYWSLLIDVVYLTFATATTIMLNVKDESSFDAKSPPWYAKAAQVMQAVAFPIALAVTAMFYILLFSPEDGFDSFDFYTHGITSIVLFVDITTNNQPFVIAHMYHAIICALIYSVWTVIHYAAGLLNRNGTCTCIYTVLNWENPGMTTVMTLGVSFVVTPLLTILIWAYKNSAVKACAGAGRSGILSSSEESDRQPSSSV